MEHKAKIKLAYKLNELERLIGLNTSTTEEEVSEIDSIIRQLEGYKKRVPSFRTDE